MMDSVLSHGTVETKDIAKTREFYEDFLGLTVIQPLPVAIYASAGGYWQLVCVNTPSRLREQDKANRFCLHVADEANVREAHEAALRDREHYGIKEICDVEDVGGAPGFALQDRDNVWWEISTMPLRPLEAQAA